MHPSESLQTSVEAGHLGDLAQPEPRALWWVPSEASCPSDPPILHRWAACLLISLSKSIEHLGASGLFSQTTPHKQ